MGPITGAKVLSHTGNHRPNPFPKFFIHGGRDRRQDRATGGSSSFISEMQCAAIIGA